MKFKGLAARFNLKTKALSLVKSGLLLSAFVLILNWFQTRNLPDSIPPLSIVGNDRGVTDISHLLTQKDVTIIYVFAPWCGVCKLSLPVLEAIRANNPSVSVLPVALAFDTENDVDAMVSDAGYQGKYYYGDDHAGQVLRIGAFPTMMFVSKNAKVRAASLGYTTRLGIKLRVFWAGLF